MNRIYVGAVLLAFGAIPGLNAQALDSLPVTPWFDLRHGSIRGLTGWGGAARVTETFLEGLAAASVSPSGKYALVQIEGQWNWVRFLDGGPDLDAIDGLTGELSSVAWSTVGNCAVAVSGGTTVRRICGSRGGAQLDSPVEVPGAQRAVVSRTGRWIAVSAATGEAMGLWVVDADSQVATPMFGLCPATMSFGVRKDVLLVADCRSSELVEMSSFAAGPRVVSLGFMEGEAPVAAILETAKDDLIALVRQDGLSAALFSREARTIVGEFQFLEEVESLQYVSPGVYLAFPSKPQGQLQLIDFHRDEKVFFVPAAAGSL
jgi:hypothetical protein